MANSPKGSQQLSRQPPHHYKVTPEEAREADKTLERLAHKLAKDKGITVAEAREELRHLV